MRRLDWGEIEKMLQDKIVIITIRIKLEDRDLHFRVREKRIFENCAGLNGTEQWKFVYFEPNPC